MKRAAGRLWLVWASVQVAKNARFVASVVVSGAVIAACGGAHGKPPDDHGIGRGNTPPPVNEGPPTVITRFHQGSAGNCTSVAFIKAALRAYGRVDGLLTDVTRGTDGGLRGRTHAGVTIDLTAQELAQAAEASRLIPVQHDHDANVMLTAAREMFAVIGKACQLDCTGARDHCPIGDRPSRCSYAQALEFLDDQLNWRTPPQLLGLKQGVDWNEVGGGRLGKWYRVTRFTSGGRACVAATRKHTFFVGDGWADKWGTPTPFQSKFGSLLAFRSIGAYCLTTSAGPDAVELLDEGAAPADEDSDAVFEPPEAALVGSRP